MAIRVQEAASLRLDEIYRYTRDRWGEAQAETYITGLFAAFERIENRGVMSKPVPAEFGVEGYFFRYERHFVYWRRLSQWRHRYRHGSSRADASDGSLQGGLRLTHCPIMVFPDKA